MNTYINIELLLEGATYILMYFILIFLAKWVKGFFSKFSLDEELTIKDNYAVAVSVTGYFVGITFVYIGALDGPSYDFSYDVLMVSSYSLAGIVLLNLTRLVNDKLILYKFSPTKEILHDQNPGTGAVEAGLYIASGLVIAGAIHGEGGSPLTAFVFFLIGQICLIIFAFLYTWLTPFDVHDEIEQDNVAAGLGFSGGMIAIGIIIMKAVSGDFEGWIPDLTRLGIDIAIVFVYLAGVKLIFDRFILRHSNMVTEIVSDRNIGVGLLEMFMSICFSAVLAYLV